MNQMLKPLTLTSISKRLCGAMTLALLALVAPASQAQTDFGTITIVVNPPAGAVTITLKSQQGVNRNCTTRDDGRCVFPFLEPGAYEVRAGSSVSESTPPVLVIQLTPGQRLTRLVAQPVAQLEILKATPVVPLSDEKLAERTIPARRGERVTARQLEVLPNRNQSEAPLSDQQPGAFSTGADTFGGFIFNGQPGSQNVLREGGLNSSPIVRSSASFQDTNALFVQVKDRQSIKKYASFGLDTSNTPADFGTGTGGQLIQNIKSGGNKLRGEVYEYLANDAFSARDFFDFARKPPLRFNLFGFSLGGPLHYKENVYPQLFAFINYEGIRARSGNAIFAAAPKLSLASRAVPAIAPLLGSFRTNGANIVSGATTDPDFDILSLDARNVADRNSLTTRFDYQLNKLDKIGFIYIGSRSTEDIPDGQSGRRNVSVDISHRGIFNYNRAITTDSDGDAKLTNQFILGVISEPARAFARDEAGNDPALARVAIAIGGEVAQTGVPDQAATMGITTAGGLLRGDFDGRRSRLGPKQFSFIDQVEWTGKKHSLKFGGELRLLRTSIDQLFGSTYKFATIGDFLAGRTTVEYSGDLGSFSGNAGPREVAQEYYIGYLQDAWKIRTNLLLTYGLRYEYYSTLRERQDRLVNLDPVIGTLVAADKPLYKSRKDNFLPRVSFAWAPNWKGDLAEIQTGPMVISGSFGMHVGPDVFANILGPITGDRLRISQNSAAFPVDQVALIAAANREDARFKPLTLSRDYSSPARVYKFDLTLKRELIIRETQSSSNNDDKDVVREMFFTLSYVGARSRNLLLRNFGNRIVSVQTNPDPTLPANVKREFDVERNGQTLHPYGELEYLTTGGRANYDSFQASLRGRLRKYLRLFQVDYTLAQSRGNSDGDDVIGAGNPLDYNYDFGYNAGDVRQKLSFGSLFFLSCLNTRICTDSHSRVVKELLGGWTIAAIGSFQTGVPIDVRLKRPDVVYIDQAGNVSNSPGAGLRAVLNVPGGGSSVAAYRPSLVPGASPYLKEDRRFLNPAAFTIPAPGTLGNLSRGALRGPGFSLVDLSVRKEIAIDKEQASRSLNFNVDFTNIFNITNFKLPSAKLPDVLGTDIGAHQLQPGQPFNAEAAGTFGILSRTFKRKADLGASRQIQFGVSLKF
jgi:TonB dependent receptor-like, beta-barrel